MSVRRGDWGIVARSAAIFALLGSLATGCGGDVVPDDRAAPDRQIDLPIEEDAAPELSDVGERQTPEEAVRRVESATPPPPPPPVSSSPVRRAPPQALPSPPEAEGSEPEAPSVVPEEAPEMQFVTMTAPAGAELEVELLEEISTRNNRPGDRFTAAITRPVIEGNRVLVPVNSLVHGEITAVQKSGGSGQEAIIKLRFIDVFFNGETWPLSASVVEANPETRGRYSTGDKVARAGAGAVVGGILGRVLGGNTRGTVIGAAVGAAAGTAITLATEDVDAVLAKGSILRLRLDEPLTFRVPNPSGQ